MSGMPESSGIAEGMAHVWVMAHSRQEAEERAKGFLAAYGMEVEELETFRMKADEMLPHLGKKEQQLYETAKRLGIAVDILPRPE